MEKDIKDEELEAMQDIEEEDWEVIAMADENGNESQFVVEMYIELEGKTYAIMHKLTEENEIDDEDGVYAFRAEFEDEELTKLEEIDDEEIAMVGQKYEEICKEMEEA